MAGSAAKLPCFTYVVVEKLHKQPSFSVSAETSLHGMGTDSVLDTAHLPSIIYM